MQTHAAEVVPERVVGLAGPIRAFRPDNTSERNMSGCECKRDSAQPSIKGRCTNTRFGAPANRRAPMITKAVFALLFTAALIFVFTATFAAFSAGRNP